MTTITSMAELRTLDVGTIVTANNSRWSITSEGAQRGQFVVSLDDLISYVNSGTMTVGISPEAGQVWIDGRHAYQLIAIDPLDCTRFWAASYRDDYFNRVLKIEPSDHWTAGGPEKPSYMTDTDYAYQVMLVEEKINSERFTRQLESARSDADTHRRNARSGVQDFRNRLAPDLHKWMEEEGHDHRSDLADILENHGIDRPPAEQEEVEFTVDFSGYHTLYLDDDDLQDRLSQHLGDGVVVTSSEEVSVYWTLSLTGTREVDMNSCACENFDMSDARDLLREHDHGEIDSFEFEMNCDND